MACFSKHNTAALQPLWSALSIVSATRTKCVVFRVELMNQLCFILSRFCFICKVFHNCFCALGERFGSSFLFWRHVKHSTHTACSTSYVKNFLFLVHPVYTRVIHLLPTYGCFFFSFQRTSRAPGRVLLDSTPI